MFALGDIPEVIAAVRNEMKFIEQGGREDPGVREIQVVVIAVLRLG
jgi:hypothetical protein